MARKRYNEEDILRLLREIEVHLYGGIDIVSACRTAGISDKTYYGWRKRYGSMGRAKLSEFKALEKENQRLKRFWQSLNWIS
jgi:transposase-like protein